MGQQQLFLMVLAAIIIGAAVVLGLNSFGESSRTTNEHEIRVTLMSIAARAQSWYHRPIALGGGGRTYESITLDKINFKAGDDIATFTISDQLPGSFRVTGTSKEDNTQSFSVDVYPDEVASVP